MQSSKLGYQKWAIAIYLLSTRPKGYSSRQLAADLGVSPNTAWHLTHRIREGFDAGHGALLPGLVEIDSTFIGGLEKNKHADKRLHQGTGHVGKEAVVGLVDRSTRKLITEHVPNVRRETMERLVATYVEPGALLYTDEHGGYARLSNRAFVTHGQGEYVRGDVHTQNIESARAIIKRMHKGTYHSISPKHLHRYVRELAGRHNLRG